MLPLLGRAAALIAIGTAVGLVGNAVRPDGVALRGYAPPATCLAGATQPVAEVLWAAVHGVVSLELAGHFPGPEAAADRFQTLTSAAIVPFLPDHPTHPIPRTPPRPRRP